MIRLWIATWRFNGNVPTDSPSILFMWHEELFPVAKCAAHQDWVSIVSASKDGDYLQKLISHWGYKVIRGSASKHPRAVKVLREVIAIAKHSKMSIGIDGPRGPRRQIKIGMLLAAQKTGVPVYLVRILSKGFRLKNAWDKLFIPYPFAKITIATSEAFIVDKDLDRTALEELGLELTDQLNQLAP